MELNDLFDESAKIFSRRRIVNGASALLVTGLGNRFAMISPAAARPSDQGLLQGEGTQPEWRFCPKCFGMFYNGDQRGRKGVCPAGGGHEPQGFNFHLYYSISRRQPAAGRDSQFDWRFCAKCFVMFWNGDDNRPHGGSGFCPVVERETFDLHWPYGFLFGLPHDSAANAGQSDWRFCSKCNGLFFDDPKNSNKGRCPKGSGHVRASNSFNFQLAFTNEWIGAHAAPAAPHISVTASGGNTFVMTGSGFVAGAKIIIRLVDSQLHQALVDTHGGIPFAADAAGKFTFTLVGLCRLRGALYFSATDGRKVPSTVDITGNLWSNTVQLTCS